MIIKQNEYELSNKDKKIPIILITNKYDVEYNLFNRLLDDVEHNINETDIIHMGVLIRYKEKAGRILGISFNFHFKNETRNEIITTEFFVYDGLNIPIEDVYQYTKFVESKLKHHDYNFKYFIKHNDIR